MNGKVSSMVSFLKSNGRIKEIMARRWMFLEEEGNALATRTLAQWHRPSLRKLLRRMQSVNSLEADMFWQEKMDAIRSQ